MRNEKGRIYFPEFPTINWGDALDCNALFISISEPKRKQIKFPSFFYTLLLFFFILLYNPSVFLKTI